MLDGPRKDDMMTPFISEALGIKTSEVLNLLAGMTDAEKGAVLASAYACLGQVNPYLSDELRRDYAAWQAHPMREVHLSGVAVAESAETFPAQQGD
jgi:hypothetical protein